MLDSRFTPQTIEHDVYQAWLKAGVFECGLTRVVNGRSYDASKPTFTMMMPPPNVTGALHIGHALNGTLQDILARFKRQCGFDVLWQPGIDHAGIATQFVVERQLKDEGTDRKTLGREKFIERVWQWKEESGNTIFNQMERLGISPDWSRARFTMDDGLSQAVRTIFVRMYNDGLIYKDKRLVNWDPILQTAVSDLEVFNEDEKGHMYHIKYMLHEDACTDNCDHLVVATTRPETLFGDTGVAVNPQDTRYAHLIGQPIYVPLINRLIPIVGDEHCEMDFGTGVLKVTPAHDFNDFEIGKRHNLELLTVLNADGSLNEVAPTNLQGLKDKAARTATIQALEDAGLLVSTEPHNLSIPYSEKSRARIEPYLTDQWFVNVEGLAHKALKAVEDGETVFFPKQWENTYFDWMKNIQPWCISRQIWWGHQIPAWYGPDGHTFVAHHEADAQSQAYAHYGHDVTLTHDQDVLDTWFSSAFWPFSTLGWPDEDPALMRYYPTSVLITGFDIIFFWVARMMMSSLYTQHKVPFEKVYIHALVRDEKGQKMSKTKGNVLNPLDLIDEYGADALRLTLAMASSPGRDIKIGKAKVEHSRNFLTKIWNAGKFLMMQEGYDQAVHNLALFKPEQATIPLAQWIISRTYSIAQDVFHHLEAFRFDLALQSLYHFVWDTYCDFFIEFMKPLMQGDDHAVRQDILTTALWSFEHILSMLQPAIPFITHHMWVNMGLSAHHDCAFLSEKDWLSWDGEDGACDFTDAKSMFNHIVTLIQHIRSVRANYRVPPASQLNLTVPSDSPVLNPMVQTLVQRMARIQTIGTHKSSTHASILLTLDGSAYYVDMGDSIDMEAECARLKSEIQTLEKDLKTWTQRLNNHDFVTRAKPEVVEELRERIEVAQRTCTQKHDMIAQLTAA